MEHYVFPKTMGCSTSSRVLPYPYDGKKVERKARSRSNPFSTLHQNADLSVERKIATPNNSRPHESLSGEDMECSEEFSGGMLGVSTKEQYEKIIHSLGPGKLFEDADFPADMSTLFINPKRSVNAKIEWLRPHEILADIAEGYLIKDGVKHDDIKQGILGDCGFLSSCAAVSRSSQLMSKIIPEHQTLSGPRYKGIIRFNFWRFGEWIQVLVDDRLPTVRGKLIYGQSTDPAEFWVALIEKAYAKLHGSYEAIEGSIAMDALVDLTGGLAERYELADYNPSLYKLISRAYKSGAFIVCSRNGDWRLSTRAEANGLIPGHAYTVTDVTQIKHKMGEEKLLQIRNPWGDETEWRGSWSDNDENWEWVSEETKAKIQRTSKDDGEFWISFKDFCHHFREVTICLMGPDFDGDGVSDHVGHVETITGEWIPGVTAGGSRNNLSKFATNDQYLLTITEPDEFNQETDDPENEGMCHIVVSLMQEHRRSKRNVKIRSHQIGFFIYKTEDTKNKLSLLHFRYNPDIAKTLCYMNSREVSGCFQLEPGHYVIIPTTFNDGCAAFCMLRVFGEKKFTLKGTKAGNLIYTLEKRHL